ncbi:type I-B CRISPR-associated protein Cas7/Cst2/DevR [Dissulfurispira sp.]|uniref:type I-B CRISPR-associated protein Cas7/Cst2/DevR n=1 Tax=Dissulfurispira sp. TaxID=2817609 RepID=UPI002FDA50F7
MSKGLTVSIIFNAQSLNYGEGTGNVSELKKLSRDNGLVYSYASRQAIRYDIVRIGMQHFNWPTLGEELESVGDGNKKTIQFAKNASISISPEIDFFGYMKTEKGRGALNRAAVVRLSSAVALEPYLNDIEFLSNKGLADRMALVKKEDIHPNIAQLEQHMSFYTYTVTVDLDRVGIDEDIKLDNMERAKRVKELLEILKVLNREIKGRVENLNPLFVIGGIYDIKNPFFMGRLKLEWKSVTPSIALNPIKETLSVTFKGQVTGSNTYVGLVSGIWGNEDELKQLPVKRVADIETVFSELAGEVKAFYESA